MNIATQPVEAAYLVFVHTDAEGDVRDLAGFKHVSEYGQRKVIDQNEIGSVENFRFITSPELAPYTDSGAAVGATGLYTSGTLVDVYPFIICGEDAWGQIALRGDNATDPTYIAPGEKSKSDPLGQRGFVGAKFWFACKVLNEGWMAVIEAVWTTSPNQKGRLIRSPVSTRNTEMADNTAGQTATRSNDQATGQIAQGKLFSTRQPSSLPNTFASIAGSSPAISSG